MWTAHLKLDLALPNATTREEAQAQTQAILSELFNSAHVDITLTDDPDQA